MTYETLYNNVNRSKQTQTINQTDAKSQKCAKNDELLHKSIECLSNSLKILNKLLFNYQFKPK